MNLSIPSYLTLLVKFAERFVDNFPGILSQQVHSGSLRSTCSSASIQWYPHPFRPGERWEIFFPNGDLGID